VAEVAYFLRANGSSTTSTVVGATAVPSLSLYTLYRRQLLAVVDNSTMKGTGTPRVRPVGNLTTLPMANAYAEISCKPDPVTTANIYFNTATSLIYPERRFAMDPGSTGGLPQGTGTVPNPYPVLAGDTPWGWGAASSTAPPGGVNGSYMYASLAGADILLTDVVSLNVQAIYKTLGGTTPTVTSDFADLPVSPANAADPTNSNFTTTWHVFDTWANTADPDNAAYNYLASLTAGTGADRVPLNISIKALKITIRIWDRSTQQTRQVTVIQDM
jgi:hypothetical protein